MVTLSAFLARAASALRAAALEEPWREARWLVREVLCLSEADLLVRENVLLRPEEGALLEEALRRRVAREPIPHITGRVHFLHWQFAISPGLFVPRPETEVWVEAVAQRLSRGAEAKLTAIDVGCGIGVVGLSLCLLGAASRALLLDISPSAVAMARANALTLLPQGGALAACSDLLQAVRPRAPYALLANLPYVERSTIETLQAEIRLWEARQALDGGDDGLDLIRRLLQQVPTLPDPPRLLALEVGAGQAGKVKTLVRGLSLWKSVESVRDYSGIERAVVAHARD